MIQNLTFSINRKGTNGYTTLSQLLKYQTRVFLINQIPTVPGITVLTAAVPEDELGDDVPLVVGAGLHHEQPARPQHHLRQLHRELQLVDLVIDKSSQRSIHTFNIFLYFLLCLVCPKRVLKLFLYSIHILLIINS